MSISDKLTVVAENVPKVFDAGKLAERETFWESFQGGGKRTQYRQCFYLSTNLEKFFFPKYDIIPTYGTEMFRGAKSNNFDLAQRLRDCGVVLDTSKMSEFSMMFYFANIMILPVISFEGVTFAGNLNSTFTNCYAKTIEKIILPKTVGLANGCFQSCTNLENITFEGTLVGNGLNLQWSPLLSKASIESVINCLEDKSADTSGTSWVVTLGTANLAKLTDAEKAIATQKGWTLS